MVEAVYFLAKFSIFSIRIKLVDLQRRNLLIEKISLKSSSIRVITKQEENK